APGRPGLSSSPAISRAVGAATPTWWVRSRSCHRLPSSGRADSRGTVHRRGPRETSDRRRRLIRTRSAMPEKTHRFGRTAARIIIAVLFALALAADNAGFGQPSVSPSAKNFKFVNGRWFDGRVFQRKVFYAVGGLFADRAPERIDETVDLKDGFVVPPF